ncbi:MAG: hypothetical protein QOF76_3289 [Solirubrobacteraceae bacterium]|jgi:hypothetical protein|nr:hypothetical protein [Solirubrobacteraceae bacterium]
MVGRVRALAPWLAVFVLYAAAVLILGAHDPAPVVPPVLERAEDAVGTRAVELILAALAAVSFALGAVLARRWVPDPWATRGVLVVALSPLGFQISAGTRPGAIAAAMLAGGTVLALRVRDNATRPNGLGAAFLLAFAPWFGLGYAAGAIPPLLALIVWTYRRHRPLLGLLEIEVAGASAVALAGVEPPDGVAATPGSGPERLAALLVDRGVGLLRWAPMLLLAFGAVYLLARSRKEKLAQAIPSVREAEVAAALSGVMVLGLAGAAAFGAVTPSAGLPFAAALGAWSLRRIPRIGAALALITLAGTVWVAIDLATNHANAWLGLGSDAPWGPLARAFVIF